MALIIFGSVFLVAGILFTLSPAVLLGLLVGTVAVAIEDADLALELVPMAVGGGALSMILGLAMLSSGIAHRIAYHIKLSPLVVRGLQSTTHTGTPTHQDQRKLEELQEAVAQLRAQIADGNPVPGDPIEQL